MQKVIDILELASQRKRDEALNEPPEGMALERADREAALAASEYLGALAGVVFHNPPKHYATVVDIASAAGLVSAAAQHEIESIAVKMK